MKGDWEVVIELSLLSGRYYPRVLTNPLLSAYKDRLLRLGESVNHLYALEGLVPGYHNSASPEFSKEDRGAMLVEAAAKAKGDCDEWFESWAVLDLLNAESSSTTSDVEMNVD